MERTLSSNAVPKKYDESFKRQAVEMVLHGGKRVKEVAADLGVSEYSIYEWKRKYFALGLVGGSSGQHSMVSGLPEDVEQLQKMVREQQRQIAELTQQREILKKTLGIVCEEPSRGTNGLGR
jgi:transposase